MDALQQRVSFNDKLANENFITIQKNEALMSTESKLNSLRLDQLSSETSALQKLIIAQFLSLKMGQSNQEYHIKLQSEMMIYLGRLHKVASSLLEIEDIISQIFSLSETMQCSLLDNKKLCYVPAKSHINKDDISFNIILHHQNLRTQDVVFISCVPLNEGQTSFLDFAHGILLNDSFIMINDREMVSLDDLKNNTLIYSQTKPIKNLMNNNLILLKDRQRTGFFCFKPDVFIHNDVIFNCTTKIFWTTLAADDKIISSKGFIYSHHDKSLKLESRKSFHKNLKEVSNIETIILDSVFADNKKPWHHVVLDKLKSLNSSQAIGGTVGFSLVFVLLLLLFIVICVCRRKGGLCCCNDKKAELEISVQGQATPLVNQTVENESTNERARRLVTSFLHSVERKATRGPVHDEHSGASE